MAKIYNQTGSLTELLAKLKEQDISDFYTLEDIWLFIKNYKSSINLIEQRNKNYLLDGIKRLNLDFNRLSNELNVLLKEREELLTKEKIDLDSQISDLKDSDNLFGKLRCWYQKKKLNNRKNILEFKFEEEKNRPFKKLIGENKSLQKEIDDKTSNTERWVDLLSEKEIDRIKLIKSILDTNKHILYGAKGEERVANELKKLPDSYVVINNFQQHFPKPIYNKKENDWIYSIQMDHIVLGQTGIFLIETKNWSKDSMENQNFFSPVKQIRRSNFAMFIILNQAIQKNKIDYFGREGEDKKFHLEIFFCL